MGAKDGSPGSAKLEARNLKASTVDPAHLLLSLCKSVDLDLPALVPKNLPDRDAILEELPREVRRLRDIFRTAGLDAREALPPAQGDGPVSDLN